jgi:hypothetical protein
MNEEPKIVSLEAFRLAKKPPESVKPDYKEDMVKLLKAAIAEAESGKLRGFVLASAYEAESSVDIQGQVNGPEVLWLVERIKTVIIP